MRRSDWRARRRPNLAARSVAGSARRPSVFFLRRSLTHRPVRAPLVDPAFDQGDFLRSEPRRFRRHRSQFALPAQCLNHQAPRRLAGNHPGTAVAAFENQIEPIEPQSRLRFGRPMTFDAVSHQQRPHLLLKVDRSFRRQTGDSFRGPKAGRRGGRYATPSTSSLAPAAEEGARQKRQEGTPY